MSEKKLGIIDDLNNLLKTATNEEAIGILYATKAGEYKYIFEDFADDFIKNADNALINAHYVHGFCINETLNFFVNVIEQNCVDESRKDYFKNAIEKLFERLDRVDYAFGECISKLPDNKFTIKEFPKDCDDEDKAVLDDMARSALIKNTLSSNNKYNLFFRHNSRKIVKFLLNRGYRGVHGKIFMNKYINYEVNADPESIENYFRVCAKDLKLKKDTPTENV